MTTLDKIRRPVEADSMASILSRGPVFEGVDLLRLAHGWGLLDS